MPKKWQDELLWGAAWLHKATKNPTYLNYIQVNGQTLGAAQFDNTFGWDNKHVGARILLSKVPILASSSLHVKYHQNYGDLSIEIFNIIKIMVIYQLRPLIMSLNLRHFLFKNCNPSMTTKDMQIISSVLSYQGPLSLQPNIHQVRSPVFRL